MTSGWANEILTETIDAKGGFNILRDWYNRAVRDDPEGDGQARAPRVGDRSAEADHCAEESTASIRASRREVVLSTPFSLRAELKGVEVEPGVTLRYWEAGAGRALVMLPGLGHAASLYKYQLEGLCDEFRVIALDPRGHGESDKPEGGYNYHTLAKDLDGFLHALDLNDVTILGHSGGCKIILTYLELYGDSQLRAIVFSDDSPCHLRDGIFSADQALAAIDAFQGPDAIAFSKGFSDQFLTDDAEESAKEAFYREGLKLPRPYLAKLFRWAAFGDWWDAYALVKVPTLVIGGRVSKVPVKIAQGIHEAVPGSSFVVFEADEGGGHAMFWEGPQKYNDSLRTFLRSS
jgi:non-heme chloroperoxidase